MADEISVSYFPLAAALGRALEADGVEFWAVVAELERVFPHLDWKNAMTDGGQPAVRWRYGSGIGGEDAMETHCLGCGAQVFGFKEGIGCSACGWFEEGDVTDG